MATAVFDPDVTAAQQAIRQAAATGNQKSVMVDGQPVSVPYPYPSPADWRDTWIYFLMLDRFNNPNQPPASVRWDQRYDYRQHGTFKGVQAQLGYLQRLGANALWLSPILRNSRPDWQYNYHGYEAQDFLNVDERFGSDGTLATAERELTELVEEAHARGIWVIIDIVLNHAGRVFDYVLNGADVEQFADIQVMNAPLGLEPLIRWIDGSGQPRPDWQPDLPPPGSLTPDDAVRPLDFQRKEFFRRRGSKLTDDPGGSYVRGDFGDMRQLVHEYDADAPGQELLRSRYGKYPVLDILIQAYAYMIAKYDIDGYRIDTVKYVDPALTETFDNAMREFALSAGKKNFFTFGEIADADEALVNRFIGRHAGTGEGFGIDAALDFPLFARLPQVIKGGQGVETIRQVFADRKAAEAHQISSHGEAGRYFISFLDNHDQHERFHHPLTPQDQVTEGLAVMFCLQGIPCVYYGTEQGLTGTKLDNGQPDLGSNESVREALWGKPQAFDEWSFLYREIAKLSALRHTLPALRYGRIYPREVSGNGRDFGHSQGIGGIIAFSRILADQEVMLIANTHTTQPFTGELLVDLDLSRQPRTVTVAYSNLDSTGATPVAVKPATVYGPSGPVAATIASVGVALRPMEVQILI